MQSRRRLLNPGFPRPSRFAVFIPLLVTVPRFSGLFVSDPNEASISEPIPVADVPRHPRSIPAWAMSMLLHFVLILLLFFWIDSPGGGTGDEEDRQVGVAVAHRMPDRTEYETPDPQSAETAAETSETSEAAAAAAEAPSAIAPLDVAGLLAEATETPTPTPATVGNAMEPAADQGSGTVNTGDGGGSPATISLFGISGSGQRFVFVFDRSDSMNGFNGRPLAAAKREIIRSLRGLGPEQAFQIIFYNNRPVHFEPTGQSFWMLPADDSMKQRAEAFVRSIQAFGGTEHMDALKLALRLEPDVIFFLTDARIPRLNRRHLDEVRSRSTRGGTTIHAIEFGVDRTVPGDSFLRTLAEENGGQYRYINVDTLDAVTGTAS